MGILSATRPIGDRPEQGRRELGSHRLGRVPVIGGRSLTPIHRLFPAAVALAAAAWGAAAVADTPLSPPKNFRQWFHVNSQVVTKDSVLFDALGGFHNVYLSRGGVPMLENGKPYPDGTIFVDDIRASTLQDGIYVPGEREVLAVMVRDAKKYAATGGWGFQAWAGGDPKKPLVTDATKQCFGCHTQKVSLPRPGWHEYIFSTYSP
jgi:hypothetical protein